MVGVAKAELKDDSCCIVVALRIVNDIAHLRGVFLKAIFHGRCDSRKTRVYKLTNRIEE